MREPTPPSSLVSSLARRVVALVMRAPGLILILTVVFALVAFSSARHLGVDSRLRVLLPPDSDSVVHLDRMAAQLGNHEDLYLVVRSPSRDANVQFAARLAEALERDDDIRYVIYRRDTRFFDEHVLLYASLADLLDIRRRVIERIQAEIRRELSPLGESERPEELALDEDELRERYHLKERPPEYFETDEGRVVVLIARPRRPSTDFAFTKELLGRVDELVVSLDPAALHDELAVTYAGGYDKHTQLARRLEQDVASGTTIAFIVLALTLVVYFRGIRAVPLILTPLVTAALAALAFAYHWAAHLNLVGAFMFAVLLGIGIDFGIHVLARYKDERAEGVDVRQALETTLSTAGVSTGAGAASTAFAFALLGVAKFKGISQFGVIASVGITLAFICAIVVLPAMLVLFERVWPWRPPKRRLSEQPRSLPRAFPALAALAVVIVVGGAAAGISRLGTVEFETDLRKFEVELETTDEGRARAEQYREAVGKVQSSTPAIALASSPEETAAVYRHLRALVDMTDAQFEAFLADRPWPVAQDTSTPPAADKGKDADADADADDDDDEDDDDGWGDDEDEDEEADDPVFVALAAKAQARAQLDPAVAETLRRYRPERLQVMREKIADVIALAGFVPELQEDKLTIIRDIRARIDKKRGSFTGEAKDKVDRFYEHLTVERPITADQLPPWILQQFRAEDGSSGDFVYLRFDGSKSDYDRAKVLYDAFLTVEGQDGQPVPVAATFFVTPEIFDALRRDGPIVMSLATGVLVLTAALMFRNIAGVLIVLFTVFSALAWLTGVMAIMGWRWHFFNVIALPLLIGMGQDYAIHLYHRYREEGPGRLGLVLRGTGAAIVFTTLTTVIGFSGMVFVDHPGLASLGEVSVIGLTMCLLASVVFVPALLRIGEWRAPPSDPPAREPDAKG